MIDGTEVALTTPWLGKPAAVTPAKGREVEPKPGAGAVADATGATWRNWWPDWWRPNPAAPPISPAASGRCT